MRNVLSKIRVIRQVVNVITWRSASGYRVAWSTSATTAKSFASIFLFSNIIRTLPWLNYSSSITFLSIKTDWDTLSLFLITSTILWELDVIISAKIRLWFQFPPAVLWAAKMTFYIGWIMLWRCSREPYALSIKFLPTNGFYGQSKDTFDAYWYFKILSYKVFQTCPVADSLSLVAVLTQMLLSLKTSGISIITRINAHSFAPVLTPFLNLDRQVAPIA